MNQRKPRKKLCQKCMTLLNANDTCDCKKNAIRERNKARDMMNPEEKKFFNSKRWKILRKQIIERDGGHCQRCLIKYNRIESRNLEGHHIKSRKNYPDLKWDETNLIALCRSCNTFIGIKDKLDFNWEPKEIEYHYQL